MEEKTVPSTTPRRVIVEELLKEIHAALEQNGGLTDQEFRHYSLMSDSIVCQLVLQVLPVLDRVAKLENASIILWIKQNTKTAIKIFIFLFVLTTMWFIFVQDAIPFLETLVKTVGKLIL